MVWISDLLSLSHTQDERLKLHQGVVIGRSSHERIRSAELYHPVRNGANDDTQGREVNLV